MFIPIPRGERYGRPPTLASVRVVILMLTMTVVMLGGVFTLLVTPPAAPQGPLVLYIAVGIALVAPIAYTVFRSFNLRGLRAPSGAEPDETARTRAQHAYFRLRIMAAALSESFALIALISLVTDGSPWAYAIAGLGLAGIVAQFPTQAGLDRFVRDATTGGVR